MPQHTAMAGSSNHHPCPPPPPPPPPPIPAPLSPRSHPSSSVIRLARRICLGSGGGVSSFSPPPSVIGRMWTRRRRLAAASSCFREESAPQALFHLRQLPSSLENRLYRLLCERRAKRSLGRQWWGGEASSSRCGGTGRDAPLEVELVEQEDLEEDAEILALEAEIYDFMQKSSKPSNFPTKEELIAAGRMDLVEAIAEHGGWLAYGWDFDDREAAGINDDDDDSRGNKGKAAQRQGGEQRADFVSSHHLPTDFTTAAVEHDETALSWQDNEIPQQQRELDVGKESGIEGILKRLEKERSFSYLEADNRITTKNKNYSFGAAASEVVSNGNKYGIDDLSSDIQMDGLLNQSINDMRNGSNDPRSSALNDQEFIHSRLQFLETELTSVLGSLRSRSDAVVSHKGQESAREELHKLSDALEFQETEIINAEDKIRSIRAKLVALEGKMALEMIEAQKILGEKQKRIDAAQKALSHFRTASIVWPNSASEVFLAGSFDGWTSQIKMEKSSTGIFSLYLKLYPGQYEIKFIVDGVWKIDPLRLIVYSKGYENNLLIIH